MLQKDQEYEIEIDDIGTDGEGIGHIDRFAVFVEGCLPGDSALVRIQTVKKNYAIAKLIRLLKTSALRVIPACDMAELCGGCQIQHCTYAGQLAYKTKKVKDTLKRIGGVDVNVKDALGMLNPYHYRNKIQLQIQWKDGEPVAGFYALHSHRLIPVQNCKIQHPMIEAVIQIMIRFIGKHSLSAYDEADHSGLIRHIIVRVGYHSSEVMVCIVINGQDMPHVKELAELLRDLGFVKTLVLNVNCQKTGVVYGVVSKTIFGNGFITDSIGDLKFRISAGSFFQVNPEQTKLLYDRLLTMASFKGNELIVDAYCGIGSISLYAARFVKHVYGIELEPQAIDDARINADINSIRNAEFICGDSEKVIAELFSQRNVRADAVIVDPPRKGCSQAMIKSIATMRPQKLIYVSCDPATLARDVKILVSDGYEVKDVQPVDMFPQTAHVETMVLMTREQE